MFASFRRAIAAVLFGTFVSLLHPVHAQTSVLPDTPPGRLMAAWLVAINSGDPATIKAFQDQSWPEPATPLPGQSIAENISRATLTNGYTVSQVLQSTNTQINALLRKRGDTTNYHSVTVTVAPGAPDRIAALTIRPGTALALSLLTPATLSGAALDAAKAGAPNKLFATWLDAFNSGDKARLQTFIGASWPTGSIDGQTALRDRTGGFELLKLESATPTSLVGTMKEKGADRYARFTLSLDAAGPTKIVRLAFTTIPKP